MSEGEASANKGCPSGDYWPPSQTANQLPLTDDQLMDAPEPT